MTRLYCGLLSLFLTIIVISAQWVIEDEGCRTPDRGVGNCVAIRDCEPLITFLQNTPRPLSPQIVTLLRNYQCGFEGSSAKVCCPSKPILINTNRPAPITSEPPDVSAHRNLRLLPTNCGVVSTDDRIINGNKTALFEFPWMALLSYQTERGPSFRCGGSILNNRYILTAAHCISNLKYSLIGVRVGEHDIRSRIDCEEQDGETICAPPYQDLAIEKIIPHPQYNTTAYINDIGLLRVSPMNMSVESVRPVCLPLEKTRNYDFNGKNVIVTGWGATENGRSSPELLKVEIPVIPIDECQNIYKKAAPITSKQLCAGGKNRKDSCSGDSGGPLHVVAFLNQDSRYIQQGVVSFGPRFCGLEGNPGVYTKVAYYMDWILNNIRS